MTVEEVISAFDSGKLLGDDELVEFCYLAKDYCVQREIVRNRYLEGQTVFEIGNRYFRVSCRYDNCSEYEAAGRTDHHFKGGIAYKFYDENYDTVLRDVEWTMVNKL